MPPEVKLPKAIRERLKITSVLGTFHGGQKDVFIAQTETERIAVKWVRGYATERDKREVEFYEKYKDARGIPKVLEVIQENHELIIVEEYLPGRNLADCAGEFIGQDKKIGKLLRDVCGIMDQFWDGDIVHRDLKPANIMIADDGSPTVIDFGIHRNPENTTITATGAQPGTAVFCAPEQLLPGKREISYRTDFF